MFVGTAAAGTFMREPRDYLYFSDRDSPQAVISKLPAGGLSCLGLAYSGGFSNGCFQRSMPPATAAAIRSACGATLVHLLLQATSSFFGVFDALWEEPGAFPRLTDLRIVGGAMHVDVFRRIARAAPNLTHLRVEVDVALCRARAAGIPFGCESCLPDYATPEGSCAACRCDRARRGGPGEPQAMPANRDSPALPAAPAPLFRRLRALQLSVNVAYLPEGETEAMLAELAACPLLEYAALGVVRPGRPDDGLLGRALERGLRSVRPRPALCSLDVWDGAYGIRAAVAVFEAAAAAPETMLQLTLRNVDVRAGEPAATAAAAERMAAALRGMPALRELWVGLWGGEEGAARADEITARLVRAAGGRRNDALVYLHSPLHPPAALRLTREECDVVDAGRLDRCRGAAAWRSVVREVLLRQERWVERGGGSRAPLEALPAAALHAISSFLPDRFRKLAMVGPV